MLVVRCKDCGKELTSKGNNTVSCGCPNMTTINGDSVTAVDLSRAIMISSPKKSKDTGVLSDQDLMFQEQRRKRKVRKLDFEIR